MGVRILKDEKLEWSCLYCSTTMWAFGGIFYSDEDPNEFLDWLGDTDPRSLKDSELDNKLHEWRLSNELGAQIQINKAAQQ